jgi:ParB/RepB/Spo0J family partition protein
MNETVIAPIEVKKIPIAKILKGFRYREDAGDIEGLATSIKNNGLMHPIVVCKVEDDDKWQYRLCAGGRRLAACISLDWAEIDANIYPADITELQIRILELFENLDRKDMEYAEQVALTGRIHKAMQELNGERIAGSTVVQEHSMRDTAKMLGKSVGTVSQDIKLAHAIELIPELANASDKKEAMKMLKRMEDDLEASEISAAIESNRAKTPEEIFKRQIMNSFIIGDFFEKIKEVPDKSIDLIELDPDWGDIDLDSRPVENQALHEMKVADYKKIDTDVLTHYERIIGECTRVLSDTGWLIVWFAYHPNGNAIWSILERHGLRGPGTPCIWAKPSGQVRAADTNLPRGYELFYYARKPDARLAKQGRLDIFQYRTVSPDSRIHITEKPIELMMDIYKTFVPAGARILIPFLGSGNGILAAYNLNCTAFGYELSETIKSKFIIRVAEKMPPHYCSYSKYTTLEET